MADAAPSTPGRVILFPCVDSAARVTLLRLFTPVRPSDTQLACQASDAALSWYLENVQRPGDFVQVLHVVEKMSTGIDELLHTDIRMQNSAPVNDRAVDFVFDRLLPRLAAAGCEQRVNVLRCSQAARTVGEVIVTNAARIKASLIVMAPGKKAPMAELLMGSCTSHVTHRAPCPVLVARGLVAE